MAAPLFAPDSESLVKRFLTKDLYARLSGLQTRTGFTLDHAIRSGRKNTDSHIGIYVGDAEAYTLFRDIYEPVIRCYHHIDGPITHTPDLSVPDLPDPDPDNAYILSSRVRVARNLDGIPFPPHMEAPDRKQVVSGILSACEALPHALKGNFFSMDGLDEDQIRERSQKQEAFIAGDRFQADAGINRDFPRGRGIYKSRDGRFMIWVNEEDHLRVISLDRSGDIAGVFRRLCQALDRLGRHLEFSVSNTLGFLGSCPTNIGTAMRAGVHIRLPKLEQHPDQLETLAADHDLQIRGTGGEKTRVRDAVFDLSNRRRLGVSENRLIRQLHAGITAVIQAEKAF